MGLKIVWLIVAGGCAVGFGAGFLFGQHHPSHAFQKYGETRFLLDSASGKLCDPFKDPSVASNFLDSTVDPATPKDANGFQLLKSAYPPPCGGK
jgi:hypothetical protein